MNDLLPFLPSFLGSVVDCTLDSQEQLELGPHEQVLYSCLFSCQFLIWRVELLSLLDNTERVQVKSTGENLGLLSQRKEKT